jgi:hypothetical protein
LSLLLLPSMAIEALRSSFASASCRIWSIT